MTNRRFPASLVGTLALAAAALVVPTGSAHAVSQGIAGTVSGAGGVVLQGGTVEIVPVDPSTSLAEPTIQLSGTGTFTQTLTPGQYLLRFTGYGGDTQWAPEWWQDSTTRAASTPITVTAGAVTTANVQLVPAGSISGYVDQDRKELGVHDTKVEVFQADAGYPGGYHEVGYALTAGDTGNYTVTGLATGQYKVYFHLRYSGREGWWEDATTMATGTTVSVAAPDTTSGISPVNLPVLGSVTGKVTAASNGAAVADVGVQLYAFDGDTWNSTDDGYTVTAANGTYTIKEPAGTYRVGFTPPAETGLATEFWSGATTVDAGQDVSITTGAQTTDVDASLDPAITSLTNTQPPTVSGTAKVGQNLTATEGSWQPATVMIATYQWKRNGTPITGATASTYTVAAADAGKRLSVTVTEHTQHLGSPSATSAQTPVVPLQTFKLTSAATLAGTLKVGKTLRATPPRSTPAATVKYQWLRNGVAIRGATKATHKLVRADKGKKISVRIVLSRPYYATVTKVVARSTKVR